MTSEFDLIETPYVTGLLDGFSLEATLPSSSEITAIRSLVSRGTRIYLSAPPKLSPERLLELTREVRSAGLEPVPHIIARAYPSRESLDDLLAQMSGEAGVTQALVLTGDRAAPVGPFHDALAVIESDLLQERGITHIGISSYPDGHPKIAANVLATALDRKLSAANQRELKVQIVTQFCFDSEAIMAWLVRLRSSGVNLPVRIGVAGPTNMRTLTRYALRCGVRASLKGMLNPNARQLLGEATPDDLIQSLNTRLAALNLRDVQLHLFGFGGLVQTARWASTAANTPTK